MIWVPVEKHRRVSVRDWDSGEVHKRTAEPESDSQYDPHLRDADVLRLERNCIAKGILYRDSGHKKCYYQHVGRFVGSCHGLLADYIHVEVTNNTFHGYPITIDELRRRGVNL